MAVALIGGGARGVWESLKSRQQTVLTFEQFALQKPTVGWVKITGATLDLSEAMWGKRALKTPTSRF